MYVLRPVPSLLLLISDSLTSFSAALVVSGLAGVVIALIHCALWNAEFVNTNGQLLWRVCCITQIVPPIVMTFCLAFPGIDKFGGNWDKKWNDRAPLAALVPCLFQFCARIIIFILIVYSFWSLPTDVYREADWSWSWLPQIH